MPSMPWIKLYTEMLVDEKLFRLDDSLKWRFVQLLLFAGECDQEGVLSADEDYIAFRLSISHEKLLSDLKILQEHDLVYYDDDLFRWVVTNFSKRQGRTQAEKRKQWRERQQRHRNKDNSVTGDNSVTNEGVTPLEEEEEKEKEEEEECNHDNPFALLMDAFVTETQIPAFNPRPQDVEAGNRLVKRGAKPEHVRKAYQEVGKHYNIVGLASLENPIYNVMRKRPTGGSDPPTASEVYE